MPKKDRQATRTTPGFTGPFKGAAQQGTLFDKRTMPKTGDEIGPRGYGVNRLRAVKKEIDNTPISHQGGSEGSPYGAVPQWRAPEAGSEEDTPDRKTISPWDSKPNSVISRGKSKIVDTLARSTAPVSDLKKLRGIHSMGPEPGLAGSYNRGDINLHRISRGSAYGSSDDHSDEEESHPDRTRHPKQRGPIDPDSELTLLHELGHHASALAKNDSAKYDTGPRRAAEEGRADNYALTHYRQDPRHISWQNRIDPRSHTYLARGNTPHVQDENAVNTPEGGAFPRGHLSSYRSTFGGKENDPPAPFVSMDQQSSIERRHRPMLDEHLSPGERPLDATIPKKLVDSWSPSSFDHSPSSQRKRDAVYRSTVPQRNRSAGVFPAKQAELKQRWGVNRNLGKQWQS